MSRYYHELVFLSHDKEYDIRRALTMAMYKSYEPTCRALDWDTIGRFVVTPSQSENHLGGLVFNTKTLADTAFHRINKMIGIYEGLMHASNEKPIAMAIDIRKVER